MPSFLHIFLKPASNVTHDMIKEKMDLAISWYRYADYCWVIKTSSDVAKWQTRLLPLAKDDGTLLILTIDPKKRQGWVAKGFWDWLKSHSADSDG